MPIGRAKTPGEIDAFIDDDAKRYVRSRLQLENTDQQNRHFHGIELLQRSIEQRPNDLLKVRAAVTNCDQRRVEKTLIDALVSCLLAKLTQQFGAIMSRKLLLVQSLQQQFASARSSTCGCRFSHDGARARSLVNAPQQIDHFDDGKGCLLALVAGFGAGAFDGLLNGINRQHTETDRHSVLL